MQIEGKKTTLDDDAEIYKLGSERGESKTAREHWKEMNHKERRQYFMSYYFWKLMLGLAIAVLLGYIIYVAVRPKPKRLAYIVILDCVLDSDRVSSYFDQAVLDMGYEEGKAEVCGDTSLTSSKNNATDLTTISTYLYAKTIDIMIGDEQAIEHYMRNGFFCDLDKVLPKDIRDALSEDELYYYHYVPDADSSNETEKDILYAIRLDGSRFLTETAYTTEETGYLLTLVVNGDGVAEGTVYNVIRSILGLPYVAE